MTEFAVLNRGGARSRFSRTAPVLQDGWPGLDRNVTPAWAQPTAELGEHGLRRPKDPWPGGPNRTPGLLDTQLSAALNLPADPEVLEPQVKKVAHRNKTLLRWSRVSLAVGGALMFVGGLATMALGVKGESKTHEFSNQPSNSQNLNDGSGLQIVNVPAPNSNESMGSVPQK